jgi:hypothetical protein
MFKPRRSSPMSALPAPVLAVGYVPGEGRQPSFDSGSRAKNRAEARKPEQPFIHRFPRLYNADSAADCWAFGAIGR